MPRYTFKSPEGQSYSLDGPEGSTPEQAFGVLQQHIANQRAQGVVPISEKGIDTAPVPALRTIPDANEEDLPTLLGKGVTQLAGGVAHGVGTVGDLLRNDVRSFTGEPAVPYNSEKSYSTKLSKPFAQLAGPPSAQDLEQQADAAKVSGAVSRVYDKVAGTSDLAQAIKATAGPAVEAGSTLLGARAAISPLRAAPVNATPAIAERAAGPALTPLEQAQRAGFQVLPSSAPTRNPSMAASSVPGATRESITASPTLTEGVIRHNAANATKLVGGDFGAENATKLLPEHYNAAKVAPGTLYDNAGNAVAKVGEKVPVLAETKSLLKNAIADQSPEAATPAIKTQLNRIATGLESGEYQGPRMIKDISYLREQNNPGARAVADQLETEMQNQLKDQPHALEDFRNARTQFAKIYDAQDATTGGQIDMATYARLARRRPDLLTGGAAEVANAGQELPHLTRLPSPANVASPIQPGLLKTATNWLGDLIHRVPSMDVTRPGIQQRIGQSAPIPGPLPSPTRIITGPPPRAPMVGGRSPLGPALTPGPPLTQLRPGPEPLLPQRTDPLNLGDRGPLMAAQLGLRGEAMPGVGTRNIPFGPDSGPATATQGVGVPNVSVGRSAAANVREEGAVPGHVRDLLQALIEARRRGQ